MDRRAREFLLGFERAAQLVQRMRVSPPSHTTVWDYLRDVADLNADADDLVRRGLAVGCLAAVGRK